MDRPFGHEEIWHRRCTRTHHGVLTPCASQALDRREKERRTVEGEVVLFVEDPEPLEIHGQLVDVSASGFRVAHDHAALCAGQEVTFRHAFGAGSAEVVWTLVVGHCVETSFRNLETAAL
jgi:hypothetical protein